MGQIKMTQDQDLRQSILSACLPHVPFDGWGEAALARAAKDCGLAPEVGEMLFPGGGIEMIAFHSRMADQALKQALAATQLNEMRIRDRIAHGVMLRFEQNIEHRESIRRALPLLALPKNLSVGKELIYETTDIIWRAAGDQSADWNHYSKRVLLSGVYGSSLNIWLDDQSEDLSLTREFLSRRIDDIMKISGWLRNKSVTPSLNSATPIDQMIKQQLPFDNSSLLSIAKTVFTIPKRMLTMRDLKMR